MKKNIFCEKYSSLYTSVYKLIDKNWKNKHLTKERYFYADAFDAGLIYKKENIPDYRYIVNYYESQIKELEEFLELNEIMSSWDRINRCNTKLIGNVFQKRRFIVEDYIIVLLIEGFNKYKNKLNEISESIYDEIFENFSSDNVCHNSYVYLNNASFASGSISLDENITLRNIDNKEKLDLLNTDYIFESLFGVRSLNDIKEVKAIIELKVLTDFLIDGDSHDGGGYYSQKKEQNIVNPLRHAINALKLISENALNHSKIYSVNLIIPFMNLTSTIDLTPKRKYFEFNSFVEEKDDQLLKLFKCLNKKNLSNSEKISIERLVSLNNRATIKDRLIDVFIGFEAMILGEICKMKSHGELKFRLSLLASKYLSDDPFKQKEIFSCLKKGYDLRSSIIHGNKLKTIDSEIYERVVSIYKDFLTKWFIDKLDNKSVKEEDIMFGGPEPTSLNLE